MEVPQDEEEQYEEEYEQEQEQDDNELQIPNPEEELEQNEGEVSQDQKKVRKIKTVENGKHKYKDKNRHFRLDKEKQQVKEQQIQQFFESTKKTTSASDEEEEDFKVERSSADIDELHTIIDKLKTQPDLELIKSLQKIIYIISGANDPIAVSQQVGIIDIAIELIRGEHRSERNALCVGLLTILGAKERIVNMEKQIQLAIEPLQTMIYSQDKIASRSSSAALSALARESVKVRLALIHARFISTFPLSLAAGRIPRQTLLGQLCVIDEILQHISNPKAMKELGPSLLELWDGSQKELNKSEQKEYKEQTTPINVRKQDEQEKTHSSSQDPSSLTPMQQRAAQFSYPPVVATPEEEEELRQKAGIILNHLAEKGITREVIQATIQEQLQIKEKKREKQEEFIKEKEQIDLMKEEAEKERNVLQVEKAAFTEKFAAFQREKRQFLDQIEYARQERFGLIEEEIAQMKEEIVLLEKEVRGEETDHSQYWEEQGLGRRLDGYSNRLGYMDSDVFSDLFSNQLDLNIDENTSFSSSTTAFCTNILIEEFESDQINKREGKRQRKRKRKRRLFTRHIPTTAEFDPVICARGIKRDKIIVEQVKGKDQKTSNKTDNEKDKSNQNQNQIQKDKENEDNKTEKEKEKEDDEDDDDDLLFLESQQYKPLGSQEEYRFSLKHCRVGEKHRITVRFHGTTNVRRIGIITAGEPVLSPDYVIGQDTFSGGLDGVTGAIYQGREWNFIPQFKDKDQEKHQFQQTQQQIQSSFSFHQQHQSNSATALIGKDKGQLTSIQFANEDEITAEIDMDALPRCVRFFIGREEIGAVLTHIPPFVRFCVSFSGTGSSVEIINNTNSSEQQIPGNSNSPSLSPVANLQTSPLFATSQLQSFSQSLFYSNNVIGSPGSGIKSQENENKQLLVHWRY
ncbi:MAG: hypothetical protein EZS28_017393 [Streblomastix strix]|uniref:Uncharacterized protein n=1 Tax=Streblomastix strix TaxID=222440 RepID=A0A5J4VXC0_9EUKA|nr:MAG: hypothetical protein EZS28_017393 [Streblomastix strix]